ncbi:MAG: DNA adenine methylase [Bacteroidales bacterium]|nr:DNA adenine methylase [Bacteroidales bacterium]
MDSSKMKTPISYYGGKQLMARYIIPNIPEHKTYVEPFCGGAAIFFAKPKSELEILNDTDKELINFYDVLQNDFISLEKEVRISLHSRDLHRKAWTIYNNPEMLDKIKRAWAIWILSSQGFVGMLSSSWGRDKTQNKSVKMIRNKRINFTEQYAIRMQDVTLESRDAIKIIKTTDFIDAFFYCDPPYYNADMGHYDGYTIEDFELLLKTHKEIIEEVFNCNVYTQYGCSELRDIANECELRKLHVRMDAVYTESVWGNKPVASGEKGKLVITNLVNYKMPLIRYEVGDTVRWSNKKCGCGRNTTVIENIEGRNADYLYASDYSVITQRDIDEILSKVNFIDYYQVIQKEYNHLDIFFMSSNKLSVDISLPHNIKEEINSLFKTSVLVNFQRVPEILPRQSKKYRFVYSKINNPTL